MIERLAAAERELADELIAVGERHKADHDVFHMTRTLAGIEREHIDALGGHAQRFGADIESADDQGPPPSRPPEHAPLLLLSDLRRLHVLAAGASLDWVALGQGAQAANDGQLLQTVTAGHAETLRTLKWTTYRLKEAAPQALTS